ncbi:MAG: SprT-like domain-containing protein [Flammeovirgaceae bacterium]|jgi:SprT protein|nr:SprT-like domain-containing protein [Flammeovirgaceae bacterium]
MKVRSEQSVRSVLEQYILPPSVDFAFALWQHFPFTLQITKSRQTKVGDFRCHHHSTNATITINQDLNPYVFLLTYVHEVAHHHTHLQFGHKVEAHGKEWKEMFMHLMQPLLQEIHFPAEILHPLKAHMQHPKASSFTDATLTHALRLFDKNQKTIVLLSSIPTGSIFQLQGRYFKKGKLRRTRVLCEELKSKRQYLVPADAPVSDVQLSMLNF